MSTTADVTLITGTAGPGAFVPYTGTFAFSTGGSTTSFAAETFVGQILNNGNTNWLAGPSNQPFYLLTSSVDGATATTLADGKTYYYTQGPRPVFQELEGGSISSDAASSPTSITTTAATTGSDVTVISGTLTSSDSDSTGTATESAAAASSTTAGNGASSAGLKLSGLFAAGLIALAYVL
ncbi:hypothetical protein AC578_4258 [Pseudocercospora eumusae]|uniref:Uncharacterized protein n=1 Tax=Pseudocercospora eumusae TaxID=321146 RepID=A0A139HAT1_9PEZI|nr:hypothetical protein AC578_4258 [Pseudocercospora eumusae]